MKESKNGEQQLVDLARKGDRHAFDRLVLKFQNKITKVLNRYITNPNEVMDVVQETFIKAYSALPSFRGDSSFYTWLYRIAVNTAKNYLIAKGRKPPNIDVDITIAEYKEKYKLVEIDSPEENAQREEVEQILSKCIDNLPRELRAVILLREIGDLSYKDIARLTKAPIGTVRSRIFRARLIISEALKPLAGKKG